MNRSLTELGVFNVVCYIFYKLCKCSLTRQKKKSVITAGAKIPFKNNHLFRKISHH